MKIRGVNQEDDYKDDQFRGTNIPSHGSMKSYMGGQNRERNKEEEDLSLNINATMASNPHYLGHQGRSTLCMVACLDPPWTFFNVLYYFLNILGRFLNILEGSWKILEDSLHCFT